jgi:hypothetical protein
MFINNKRGIMTDTASHLERKGLAKGLKIWLDIIFYLLIVAGFVVVVLWPIMSAAGEDEFRVSVPVALDEDAIPALQGVEGVRFDDFRGELEISVSQFGPNFLFWLLTLVLAAAGVYGLFLVRQILKSTSEGLPFHPENPRRLNHLGWLILMVSVGASLSAFLFGRWARSQFQGVDLPLASTFTIYGEGILAGLLVLVLAAVWKEAVRIAEEQSLTV